MSGSTTLSDATPDSLTKRCANCGAEVYPWERLCYDCFNASGGVTNPDNVLPTPAQLDRLHGASSYSRVEKEEDRRAELRNWGTPE